MPHPIFDVDPFPMNRPEARALAKVLASSIPNPAVINLIYRESSADPDPVGLNLQQAPALVWREALDSLASDRSLSQLCDIVRARLKASQQALKAIEDVVNATSDVELRVLDGGVFFVDRLDVRDLLGTLMGKGTLGAVLVRGPKKSGKSHAHYLFEAAAAEVGAQPVYIGPGMAPTVEVLFAQLFGAIGAADESQPKLTTTDAWYGAVSARLLGAAVRNDKRLWIAVDDLGFDKDGVTLIDEEIRKFCNTLVVMLNGGQFRERIRVMLIDYPEDPVPAQWQTLNWKATTLDDTILAKDVADVLRDWSTKSKKKILASKLDSMATDLVAKIDGPPAPSEAGLSRLERLYNGLGDVVKDLEKPVVQP